MCVCVQKYTYIHTYITLRLTGVFPFTDSHLSSILGNKFDHGAESVMPILLNLVPNSAKVMATSGMAAIRLILRVGAPPTWCLNHSVIGGWLLTPLCCPLLSDSTLTTLDSSPSSPVTAPPSRWRSDGKRILHTHFGTSSGTLRSEALI